MADKSKLDAATVAPSDDAYYHCSAEWHLAKMEPFAAIIHPFAIRVSSRQGRLFAVDGQPPRRLFYASAVRLADHFGVSRWTILRAIHALRDHEWLVRIQEGNLAWPVVYQVFNHTEWALAHPGQCITKAAMPWDSAPPDVLGQRLHAVSGSRIRFYPNQLAAMRSTGLTDVQIADRWEPFYKRHWCKGAKNLVYRFVEALGLEDDTWRHDGRVDTPEPMDAE